jgi:hypothetical protein
MAECRTILKEAIAAMAADDSRLFEADFHRMKGKFALLADVFSKLESAFNSAPAIARQHPAKSFG